jgi:hypothetical protein
MDIACGVVRCEGLPAWWLDCADTHIVGHCSPVTAHTGPGYTACIPACILFCDVYRYTYASHIDVAYVGSIQIYSSIHVYISIQVYIGIQYTTVYTPPLAHPRAKGVISNVSSSTERALCSPKRSQ